MHRRIIDRIKRRLDLAFPEKRIFLKSETETRVIRLRPVTQVAGIVGGASILSWAIVATSILMIDSLGASTGREQARREQMAYELRIDMLSRDRDARAMEAQMAQERFSLAMKEVSAMQTRLLASEERRREVEVGLDVVQATLRRTIRERDAARADLAEARTTLAAAGGAGTADVARMREAEAVVDVLTEALGDAAIQRDTMLADAAVARAEADQAALEKQLLAERNVEIFGRLEKAVSVSMEPLDKMFRSAGLQPEDVLREVRRGARPDDGVAAMRFSTKGAAAGGDEAHANDILAGLDRMALYKAAVAKAPFANPVRGGFKYTSSFGYRRDPKTGGGRLHAGTDMAGSSGTPIHATADGVVTHAGWQSGYGNLVTITHAFGIETRYAHLSKIRVTKGQTVSRGTRIGDMGNTGRSTGTHLHYEVRVGGKPVNPMTYIKAASNVF